MQLASFWTKGSLRTLPSLLHLPECYGALARVKFSRRPLGSGLLLPLPRRNVCTRNINP